MKNPYRDDNSYINTKEYKVCERKNTNEKNLRYFRYQKKTFKTNCKIIRSYRDKCETFIKLKFVIVKTIKYMLNTLTLKQYM